MFNLRNKEYSLNKLSALWCKIDQSIGPYVYTKTSSYLLPINIACQLQSIEDTKCWKVTKAVFEPKECKGGSIKVLINKLFKISCIVQNMFQSI